ncbi:hypothetical protein PRIC1_007857 [Phytophthora ramorum]|nr:hypothetical protein KRP22_8160 [Phytophthora ramorum]
MSTLSSTARVNAAWSKDELSQLVQAWEEVVDDPKDRLILSTGERSTLHARFCALSGGSKRSLSSVTRQHHRLCMSYRLIVDTNRKSRRTGSPSWFELPAAEQHELRRATNKKEKGMTVVSPELFRQLDHVCGGKGGGSLKQKVVKPKRKKNDTEPEMEEAVEDAPKPWTTQDWALFVDAWQDAVDEFLDLGNEPSETVKLPNWLIRQKFVAMGGSSETTVGSITAKRRCIIQSYHFITRCVVGLEALDGSDWFELTFDERFRLQRKLVSPKSSQRVGCEIDRQTYHKIGVIIEKEEVLAAITGRKRKRTPKKARKPSVSSEALSEDSPAISPSLSPSHDDDEVSDPEDVLLPATLPPPSVYEDEEPQVDEKVVESLLEAQNARFEQLMHDLREERMEERKQNQAMLLDILHQRTPPEDPQQNVPFMESLVGKQQEQFMDLFAQMHTERQQEREDFHALLRQLCSRSRS